MNEEPVYQSTRGLKVIFVHSAIDDMGLTAAEFRVYGHISRRASEDGNAWPGVDSMAKTCRLSKPTVIDAVNELVKRKLLRVTKCAGKTTRYYLTPSADWAEPVKTEERSCSNQSNPGNAPLPRIDRTSKNEVTKGDPKKEIQEGNPATRSRANPADLKAVLLRETKDPTCVAAWSDWVEERRIRKKPITERAAELQIAQLKKHGKERWVAAIHKAIMNGWQGLFFDESKPTPSSNNHGGGFD